VLHAIALAAALAAGPLWASGDSQRGRQAYESQCGGCHSIETDRIGPRHANVVGRRAGSVSGFAYSDALRQSGLVWSPALLDRWLADPEALVPGQRMGYRLADPRTRADIIAFLATLGTSGPSR
jgi:cytochrome c